MHAATRAGAASPLCSTAPMAWAGAHADDDDEEPLLACVLVRRGRFLVGEPFFEPGLPITIGRPIANTQGVFMDLHSYSGLVLWPWGGRATPSRSHPVDHAAIRIQDRLPRRQPR